MRRFLSIVLALGLVLSFSLVTAVPAMAAPEVWVDDDAPNDPGPNDPLISDPLEDGSPAHPYDEIQEGIANVDPGGTVYVAAGTYIETILLVDGVDVLGAGADVTTIDGSGLDSVVSANGVGSGTTFDGFTVTEGRAGVGGGMYLSASSLTVTNCIFTDNSAFNMGGGMYILGNSSPTVANCIFEGNTVASFNGGGICCWSSASPTFTNNTIVNNTANINGGGAYVLSAATITNNIIVGNTATDGGGIYAEAGATPTIDYNDVWNNTGGNYGGTATAGFYDISANPEFVDEVAGDYHLDSTVPSLCIDAGDNTAVPGWLDTDFEGNPRIWGDAVDMGVDEYYVAPLPPRGAVGGTVYPIDKAALLLPWLSLGLVLILAAGGLALRRRLSHK